MIEESFVSFDTAKMLKEAKFRELTKTHYSNSGQVWETALPADYNDDFSCNTCNRPTQALAARWLREVHGIHVFPVYQYLPEKWSYVIQDMAYVNSEKGMKLHTDVFDSCEESIESGLQQAIKLIHK